MRYRIVPEIGCACTKNEIEVTINLLIFMAYLMIFQGFEGNLVVLSTLKYHQIHTYAKQVVKQRKRQVLSSLKVY